LPYTIPNYIASNSLEKIDTSHPEFAVAKAEVNQRISRLVGIQGNRTVDSFHKELGKLMWENCGMARSAQGLKSNLQRIPALREDFWNNLRIIGKGEELNQSLEKAGRVADFLELGELMCLDALEREESCGGHFRVESQTPDGEALRDDERFSFVSAWEWKGEGDLWDLHREPLAFEHVHLAQRSYK
jgi:succinate dehydrogenase / fumarate reductase flavoprotein subunit